MADSVDMGVRRDRSRMLQILSAKKKSILWISIRVKSWVLFEQENHDGFIHGFTENYVKVIFPFSEELKNSTKKVF